MPAQNNDARASGVNPFTKYDRAALLRVRTVAALLGIHTKTARRRIAASAMPSPMRVGPRQTVWPAGELADWFAAKRDGRQV